MRGIKRMEIGVAERWKEFRFYVLMKIKILSWNVRGLNAREKRSVLKSLLQQWKVDLVCLQETKMREISMFDIKE